MGKIKNTLTALTLGGAITFSGCNNDQTIDQQQKTVICQKIEDGKNLRVILITSDKYYLSEKEKEVRPKVEDIVNSGEYNVASVKTFYSEGYLASAEVDYNIDIAKDCNNKTLRVIFILSNRYYLSEKEKDVKPQLDEIVNSGKYNIQDVNTTVLKGYLVAAEVYYHEKMQSEKSIKE